MNDGDAYLDIVWRQFKKNRFALLSFWSCGLLMLAAIFAPLLASDIPFVYHDGPQTIYPWFNALFHPTQAIDLVFNMSLIAFFPWMIFALATNGWTKRRGVAGRKRIGWLTLEFILLTVVMLFVARTPRIVHWNPYGLRDFPAEQTDDPQSRSGIYAPLPFGPTEQDLDQSHISPESSAHPPKVLVKFNQRHTHWLGTANLGEDVLTQMIYGTRISMTVGLVAVSITLAIGLLAGAIAGFFGGIVDMIISRVIEIVLLFPALFLILTLVGLLSPDPQNSEQGGERLYIAMVVIGITSWPSVARLTRGEVLKQRSLDYTLAAQAVGASSWRIMFRHVLPNSLSPALVSIPFGMSGAIVAEASLSLLGFGAEPGQPSWGSLLHQANDNYHYWWLVVFPSLAIFFTVTVFNLVGNGLRDAMDPRLRI